MDGNFGGLHSAGMESLFLHVMPPPRSLISDQSTEWNGHKNGKEDKSQGSRAGQRGVAGEGVKGAGTVAQRTGQRR